MGFGLEAVHATHQDVASLFYARSVDLYLRDGGLIGDGDAA